MHAAASSIVSFGNNDGSGSGDSTNAAAGKNSSSGWHNSNVSVPPLNAPLPTPSLLPKRRPGRRRPLIQRATKLVLEPSRIALY